MIIETRMLGKIPVLDLEGKFDMMGAVELKQELYAVLGKSGPRAILNMEKVTFLDSSGIGAIVSLNNTFNQHNGTLAIYSVKGTVRTMFEKANLEDFVTLLESEEEALKLFD